MPRKNGLEALAEIKAHPQLRHIPVIMLTTSDADSDIAQSYALGANSFVTKPLELVHFLDLVKQLCAWWLQFVALPIAAPAVD
jgi:CheY-like chemotaxis protein